MPQPSEPPTAAIAHVLELLRIARQERDIAVARWLRAKRFAADPMLNDTERMVTRLQRAIAENGVTLWRAEVAQLEERARRLGVTP